MYSIYDNTEASSHKRAKTSPCSWARPALTTSPPHLSREVRLQTGWKYHAVPKLMPKLSQERIFAPFAEYNCTEYSCGTGQQQTPGRSAQFIRLKWYDIQFDWSREQENDCWLLLPSVYVRMPFFCSRLGLSRVAVKMFRDGDHNNSKLQVKFYNRYNITMHQTIISFVNSVDKLRNEFQEGVRWM